MHHLRVVCVPCLQSPKPLLIAFLALLAGISAAPAQTPSLDELVAAVVRVKTTIESDGRTVEGLGRAREGSGVVIDNDGLVLTIGYLMVEAQAAEISLNDGRRVPASVVGYDHETGFGLLRALVRDVVRCWSRASVAPARVVAKREFAGSWEYLLDEGIFTAPSHSGWSGAALISRDGQLVRHRLAHRSAMRAAEPWPLPLRSGSVRRALSRQSGRSPYTGPSVRVELA